MGTGVHDQRYQRLLDQLREARVLKGWSQQHLGQLLNRRQQFVSKFESGERKLDVVEFLDIARQLGTDPISLLRSAGLAV